MGTVALRVVTPHGLFVEERDLDDVVVRRRESRFELGSEIAVFRRHGPLIVRMPACTARCVRGDHSGLLEVGGGFAEVYLDRVTLVVSSARWIRPLATPTEAA